MENYLRAFFFILLSAFIFSKNIEIKKQISVEDLNSHTGYVTPENQTVLSESREEIIFFEDFEGDVSDWSGDSGWEITENDSYSPTHSLSSPNTIQSNAYNMISPLIALPEVEETEILQYGFHLNANMPDSDGDGDNFLEDYYSLAVLDVDALAWHVSDFEAFQGNSWWCADQAVGGYLDSWLQYLDTPPLVVPSSTTRLLANMKWAIEDPAGASVTGSCTDGWDAANVRISVDGGQTWMILESNTDPYDFECGYGWIWNNPEYDTGGSLNQTGLAKGWAGNSNWHIVNFELGDYVGQEVIIRFAFGSDPAFSTIDDASMTGFQLDNIRIMDSADQVFMDNADDLVSMNASGAVWIEQFYDYGTDGRPGSEGWDSYDAGDPFNGNTFLDLTEFAGRTIRFRFQSRYDDNDDGGIGTGLFIDDFKVYKQVLTSLYPPVGLFANTFNDHVDLSWNNMNLDGSLIYDSDAFDESIHLSGDGTAYAGMLVNVGGHSLLTALHVYNGNVDEDDNPVSIMTNVGGFSGFLTTFNIDPGFEENVILEPGWNTIDVNWEFDGSFIVGMEFDSSIYVSLDPSVTPSSHSMIKVGTGSWGTWSSTAVSNSLFDGEWGIRADIILEGGATTYNIYRDGNIIESGLNDNIFSDYDIMAFTPYTYSVSAVYADGTETDPSSGLVVIPEPQTVYEIAYDDGTSETNFSVNNGNRFANRFTSCEAQDLIRVSFYQSGDGGGALLKVWTDENGFPGEELHSQALSSASLQNGWNFIDLSNSEVTVNGDFWVGMLAFTSTNPIGVDLSSFDDVSYYSETAGGEWVSISTLSCDDLDLNEDCVGGCFTDTYLSWLGDGYCDDGEYGINFLCNEWSWDCDDCDGFTGPDPNGYCSDPAPTFNDKQSYLEEFNTRNFEGNLLIRASLNAQSEDYSCCGNGVCEEGEDCSSDCGGGPTCLIGDYNDDGTINVVDIVGIVGLVLSGDSSAEDNPCADYNGDNLINVVDIVGLVSYILGGEMGINANEVNLIVKNGLQFTSDGMVTAFDITIEHNNDFDFTLTAEALVTDYRTNGKSTRMIIVLPETDVLFLSDKSFLITEVLAANKNGFIDINLPQPEHFSISSPYPNPFNPEISVSISLPEEADITFSIYDISGRLVDQSELLKMDAGIHEYTWNAASFSSGIYFMDIISGNYRDFKKISLIK